MTIPLSDLETLAVGLFALVVATGIARRVPLLARLSVPTPVIGGMLAAVAVALLHKYGDTSVQFATQLTDFLLLVFFTTVGLSALSLRSLGSIDEGDTPLALVRGFPRQRWRRMLPHDTSSSGEDRAKEATKTKAKSTAMLNASVPTPAK